MRGRTRKQGYAADNGPQLTRSGHKRDSSGTILGSTGAPSWFFSSQPAWAADSGSVKLFVGSVPKHIGEEQVRTMFAEYGDVVEVAFIKDKRSGQKQGCCFIKYASRDEAERAIRFLNNQRILPGANAPVQVRYADGERERLGTVEHKLFVGCLNKQASEREIAQIFSPYGKVEDVYVMRDEHKQSRGCAFVKFPSRDAAQTAIRALNNIYVMRGCDEPLAVRFADPKRPKFSDSRGFAAGGGGAGAGGGSYLSRSGSGFSRSSPPPVSWRGDTRAQGGGTRVFSHRPSPPSLPQVMAPQSPPRHSAAHLMASSSYQGRHPGEPVSQLHRQAYVRGGPTFQQFPQQQLPRESLASALALTPPPPPPPLVQLAMAQQTLGSPQRSFAHLPQGLSGALQQHLASLQQKSPPNPVNSLEAMLQRQQKPPFQQQQVLQQSNFAEQTWRLPVSQGATCNWTEHISPEGFKYYYNNATNESKWEKPNELLRLDQQLSTQNAFLILDRLIRPQL